MDELLGIASIVIVLDAFTGIWFFHPNSKLTELKVVVGGGHFASEYEFEVQIPKDGDPGSVTSSIVASFAAGLKTNPVLKLVIHRCELLLFETMTPVRE